MRVNVYAEEMTDRVEIVAKEIEGREFTGVRFYLYLPVTIPCRTCRGADAKCRICWGTNREQVAGEFLHGPGDDDSAAVTFWGKTDLRPVLRRALELLDRHYERERR